MREKVSYVVANNKVNLAAGGSEGALGYNGWRVAA
jgi:hypothetical protein